MRSLWKNIQSSGKIENPSNRSLPSNDTLYDMGKKATTESVGCDQIFFFFFKFTSWLWTDHRYANTTWVMLSGCTLVMILENPSKTHTLWECIEEYTRTRNHSFAVNVVKHSPIIVCWRHTQRKSMPTEKFKENLFFFLWKLLSNKFFLQIF